MLIALLGLIALAIAGFFWMTSMPGRSHEGALPPATDEHRAVAAALERDVRHLAESIGERNHRTPDALSKAAQWVSDRLGAAGCEVRNVDYEYRRQSFRNVEGRIRGSSQDACLVVGAHYDGVPHCPAANDNATGVAALLELARRFGERPHTREIRFVGFVNEEPPFFTKDGMGSRRYASRLETDGIDVSAMLSLETIGYYDDEPGSQTYPFPFSIRYPDRGDFIAFVGNIASRDLVRRCTERFRADARFPSQGAAAPGFVPGVGWSDHSSFWEIGVPAVMVTDTAPFRYPHYHRPEDTPEKLDYERMARVVVGLESVIRSL